MFVVFTLGIIIFGFLTTLEGIQYLVIICLLISIVPIRFKIREQMMRNLAREFQLDFSSEEALKFSDFYLKILWERHSREINHIEGMLNNHKIHIYDKVHFAPFGEPYRCIIEIDGKVLNPEGKKFNMFTYLFYYVIANYFYPTSVKSLRILLQNVKEN
ncbi:MAG: hypothetical protein G01um101470_166 [Parcubacteria group bacterium Gr01-1014_70]|nr:MAG: hypothetical protein G01um101470_166 [Parcubacteria group bacterium Gr01-1014_70]